MDYPKPYDPPGSTRFPRVAAPEWALALVLLSGLALGLLAALVFARAFPFPPAGDAGTGVVGWVTVHQYPKSREQVVYAVGAALSLGTMLLSTAAWVGWGRHLAGRRGLDQQRLLAATSLAFLPAGVGLLVALLDASRAGSILLATLGAVAALAALAARITRRAQAPTAAVAAEAAPAGSTFARFVEPASVVVLSGLAVGFFVPMAVPESLAPVWARAWWLWPVLFAVSWIVVSRRTASRRAEPLASAALRDALAHAPALLLIASPFLIDSMRLRVALTLAALTGFAVARVVAWTRPFDPPRWALPACRVAGLALFAALWSTDPNNAGYLVAPGDGDHLLAWLHEGRLGRWLYRDFWFPYGPLFYLVDWAGMRLCGLDRHLLPSTVFCSTLVALGLMRGAREVLETWPFRVIGGLFLFFAWPPNSVTLRVSIGIAALVFAVRAAESGSARRLLAAGALVAVSFLYSHEVAVTVVLAATPAMCWAAARSGAGALQRCVRALAWLVAGIAAALAPVALAAAATGVLGPYLRSTFGLVAVTDLCCGTPYPSLFRLLPPAGLAPVPAMRSLARTLSGGTIRSFYLPPFVLALGAAALAFRAARGDIRRREDPVLLGLVLMGIVLFRVALGRSEEGHARFAAVPGLVVAIVLLERLALASRRALAARSGRWMAAAALAGCATLGLAMRLPLELYQGLAIAAAKFSRYYAEAPRNRGHRPFWGWSAVRSARGELFFFPEGVAAPVDATRRYLLAHTLPREGVFAFPYAFRYNVLLNRRCPVSFGPALWGAAARPEDQQRLVDELAARRVRYIVYDDSEWADFDGVAWTDRFPLVVAYIFDRYDIEKQIGPVSILRLREGIAKPPPSVLDVGRLEQRLFLRSGWFAPVRVARRSFRWTAMSATARLTLPPGSRALFVAADVYPTSPRLARRLSASVAGRSLGWVELAESEGYATLRFPLPPDLGTGPVVVRLDIEKPFPATDLRRLGLMIEKVGFE
jgi:hypothetical protein